MTVLVIVLALTTSVATAALVIVLRRDPVADPPDAAVQAALAAAVPPAGPAGSASAPTASRPRRFISVEVLNPIELAGSRGRMLGIAGSFAPGLTRRIVYDQIVKQMRQMLTDHGVVADVHVHSVHPPLWQRGVDQPVRATYPTAPSPTAPSPTAPSPTASTTTPAEAGIAIGFGLVDEVDEVDAADGRDDVVPERQPPV